MMSIPRVLSFIVSVGLIFFLVQWDVRGDAQGDVRGGTQGDGSPVFAPALTQTVTGHLTNPSALNHIGQALVRTVVDGDTLTLDDGRDVRLTGIQAPKLALGRPNFIDWPLASEAKSTLEELALGLDLTLYIDDADQDRYRRVLAHLVSGDGVWLQGAMVEKGFARGYSFPDNRRMATALYALEKKARTNRAGIWALDYYAVRTSDPDALESDFGTFQLVEGRIHDAAKVRSRIYLNFGADYRTDFTASIARSVWSLFKSAGLDPLDLEGREVRVRGWIKDFNGPLIDITHPEQIEILDP